MKLAVYIAFLLLIVSGISTARDVPPVTAFDVVPVEWPVAQGGNGHYYAIVSAAETPFEDGGMTWAEADSLAKLMHHLGRDGHLATITSAEEHHFIMQLPDLVCDLLEGFGCDKLHLGGWSTVTEVISPTPMFAPYVVTTTEQWITGEVGTYTVTPDAHAVGPVGEVLRFAWGTYSLTGMGLPPYDPHASPHDLGYGYIVEFDDYDPNHYPENSADPLPIVYVSTEGDDANPGTAEHPFATIQYAINSAAEGDTVLIMDGTYTGAGNRDILYHGKGITVRSASRDPEVCVIDCQASAADPHRGFWFHSGEDSTAVLEGVTISNAYSVGDGGGIWVGGNGEDIDTSPVVNNCRFIGNHAQGRGGAICCGSADYWTWFDRAFPKIIDCEFLENTASSSGGCIASCIRSGPQIENCVFLDSEAPQGGAISNEWLTRGAFAECVFEGNSASRGGAVYEYWEQSNSYFACSFKNNIASDLGGGFCNSNGESKRKIDTSKADKLTDPLFENCVFENNSAFRGGAIYVSHLSEFDVLGCTLVGNTASFAAGGIHFYGDGATFAGSVFADNSSPKGGAFLVYVSGSQSVEFTGSTFVGNSSPIGAAIDIERLDVPSLMPIRNCLLVGNLIGSAILVYDDPDSEAPEISCTNIFGNEGGDWVGYIENSAGIGGNLQLDPMFCNLVERDLNLMSSSPCAAENNPGCGRIGALGVACNTPQWVDIATAEMTSADYTTGVALVDVDGDGDPDPAWASWGTATGSIFANDSGTSFLRITGTPLDQVATATSLVFGTVDVDYLPEIFIGQLAPDSEKVLLENSYPDFTDITSELLACAGDRVRSASWIDYDGDGMLDLHVPVFDGPDRMFRKIHGQGFVEVDPGDLAVAGTSLGAAWGDVDNDGDPDCYVITRDTPNVLLRNDGGGHFADATTAALATSAHGQGAAWGDYDNDGWLDLYLTNADGENVLFHNEGHSVGDIALTPMPGVMADIEHGQSGVWLDYDLDGDLDLYLTQFDAPNRLYENGGGGVFTDVATGVVADGGPSLGAAVGDIDGDGDPDLLMGNYGAENRLLRNEQSTGNHWLTVRLRAPAPMSDWVNNTLCIGARVRIVTGATQQIREIGSNRGMWSQNAIEAHFGLGSTDHVDALEVVWPWGETSSHAVTAVDEILTIEAGEFTSAVYDTEDLPRVFRLSAAHPNPFNPMTTISYELPQATRVTLTIHDIRGHLIATLVDGRLTEPGQHESNWRGCNEQGQAVATGVYFYRIEAGDFVQTRRMTLLK